MPIRFSMEARRGLKRMPLADQTAIVGKLFRYAELIDGIYVVRIAHRRHVYR